MEQPDPDNKIIIQTRVHPEIKPLILRLCRARGQDLSEYLRYLINRDLDEHGLLEERRLALVKAAAKK